MQTVRALGASLDGSGALAVTVEARIQPKDDAPTEIVLTGLPDPVLRESRGKLLCALAATRIQLPGGRVYLNLVPAARRKSGEALDLALAAATIVAAGHLPPGALHDVLLLGEVGIDGRLHPVAGGLAAAVAACERGVTRLIAPRRTAEEAAALAGIDAFAAADLAEVLALLAGAPEAAQPLPPPSSDESPSRAAQRLDEVRGQEAGKVALEVAAAGGHGILFVGPPGAGKSMLARRLIDLLPPPTLAERIEVTGVLSAAGRWPRGLVRERPFRAPHHTTSFAGLVGGGSPLVPGELTFAHRGVLFLDELPEFSRESLEALRQPLEEGSVHLARAGHRATLPARVHLATAMNPCPCGHRGDPRAACTCAPSAVARYRARISGPLLDRIDLRVPLSAPDAGALLRGGAPPDALRGEVMAQRVADARARQVERGQVGDNAGLAGDALEAFTPLSAETCTVLEAAAERRALSGRAVQSLRRVARTIADLNGDAEIGPNHVRRALGLRSGL